MIKSLHFYLFLLKRDYFRVNTVFDCRANQKPITVLRSGNLKFLTEALENKLIYKLVQINVTLTRLVCLIILVISVLILRL